ncbi:MAG: DUF1207 domain-containing protein [Deltaproteobacteria bacterium]|nr:DUF1207 domain-containing protein [Deltaproteobacteria bacterium]
MAENPLENKIVQQEAHSKKIQWNVFPPRENTSHTTRTSDLWDTSAMLMVIPQRTFIGKIGIKIPIIEALLSSQTLRRIRLEIDLLTFNHMSKNATNHRFYLNTSDTKFGFHIDYLFQPWALRFGAKHRSAHLADGLLSDVAIERGTYPRKNGYSQEFLESYVLMNSDYIKPYTGFTYVVRQGSPKKIRGKHFLGLHGGIDLTYPNSSGLIPMLSLNLIAQEEFDFHISQSYLAGLKIAPKTSDNSLIVGLNYYDGADPRGEFFGNFTHFWGVSLQYLF